MLEPVEGLKCFYICVSQLIVKRHKNVFTKTVSGLISDFPKFVFYFFLFIYLLFYLGINKNFIIFNFKHYTFSNTIQTLLKIVFHMQ